MSAVPQTKTNDHYKNTIMEEDDDATEIIPSRRNGNGKAAMPFKRLPFGSFAACFIAIIVMSVITVGVLCWFNRRLHDRIQWIAEVLMIGRTKADENFRIRSQQYDIQGHSDPYIIEKSDSLE